MGRNPHSKHMILYEDEKIKVTLTPASTLVEVKPGTSMLEAMAKYPQYMQPKPPKMETKTLKT